jgi:hypothetical protein
MARRGEKGACVSVNYLRLIIDRSPQPGFDLRATKS